MVANIPLMSGQYRSLEARFGYNNVENFDHWSFTPFTNYHKFQRDLLQVVTVFENLYVEIQTKGTFTHLSNFLVGVTKIKDDEKLFVEQLTEKRKQLNMLYTALNQEKERKLDKLKMMEHEIGKAQVILLDAYRKLELRLDKF